VDIYIGFVERVSQLDQVSCPGRLVSLLLSDSFRAVVVALDGHDGNGASEHSEILVCYAGKNISEMNSGWQWGWNGRTGR
jgi:hypothetical protein